MSQAYNHVSTGLALTSVLLLIEGNTQLAQYAAIFAVLCALWAVHSEVRNLHSANRPANSANREAETQY